uniref:Secreted protein n=1 Tax=Caenorhabditis tropicalis TaxID=1561998 RepID=A0A1I7T1P5_9PELO
MVSLLSLFLSLSLLATNTNTAPTQTGEKGTRQQPIDYFCFGPRCRYRCRRARPAPLARPSLLVFSSSTTTDSDTAFCVSDADSMCWPQLLSIHLALSLLTHCRLTACAFWMRKTRLETQMQLPVW